MRLFAEMFEKVDETTGTNEKISAMVEYFGKASLDDKIWATLLLRNRVRRHPLTSHRLRQVFIRLSGAPEWLLAECYAHVGDTGETLALLKNSGILPIVSRPLDRSLSQWMDHELVGLRKMGDTELDARVMDLWETTPPAHWFLLNKLLTGGFRVGVSERLVIKALAQVSGLPDASWQQWMMGKSDKDFEYLRGVFSGHAPEREILQAVPFCLASPVEDNFFVNEKPVDYNAEWKWDGIRAQIIKKDEDKVLLWSRGEEVITDSFPEIPAMAATWGEDVILDGELLVWGDGKPRDFHVLQQRLGRKKLTSAVLKDTPCTFIAYDMLNLNGVDLTPQPLIERRRKLEEFVGQHPHPTLMLSRTVPFSTWDELKLIQLEARGRGAEGLMLKSRMSPYTTGRKRGVWWKFKVQPYSLDAVLLYAQAGSGKRANLFTDYTFALWQGDKLVPFAKAYSGLDNQEIEKLDRWIRRNTLEKFGPVRSLRTEHVFEIAFEGIAESTRHKSGIAVRFPRILRWRHDKKVADADRLEDAWKLIQISP